jgi:hypothetical protein
VCSISTGSRVSCVQWRNSCTRFLSVHLGIILILVLRFYSGLSGRVRTVYLFSLCAVSLLSSRFTATALVWFSIFFLSIWHSLFSSTDHCVHLYICMDPVVAYVPRCVQNGSESFGVKVLEDFGVEIGGCPPWLNSIGPYGRQYCFVLEDFLNYYY